MNGGASNFPEFAAELRLLELPLQLAVKDLRSQVVREACITIAYVFFCILLETIRDTFLLDYMPND